MDETPDPDTGLTKRQKDAVRESWRKVAAEWKIHGPEFFVRYLVFTHFVIFLITVLGPACGILEFIAYAQKSLLTLHVVMDFAPSSLIQQIWDGPLYIHKLLYFFL